MLCTIGLPLRICQSMELINTISIPLVFDKSDSGAILVVNLESFQKQEGKQP